MTIAPIFILASALAYGIGSLSFAIIVSKLMGLNDPRTVGSHNPGATNVLRTGNKTAAVLTLLGDGAKGWFAVWLAEVGVQSYPLPVGVMPLLVFVVALAVMLGHLYPLFFRFQGGKGVATALGILLALRPELGLSVMAIWLVVAAVWRTSSLAALIAAISSPFLAYYWLNDDTRVAATIFVAILVVRRHKRNIRNLLMGKEAKIGQQSHDQ